MVSCYADASHGPDRVVLQCHSRANFFLAKSDGPVVATAALRPFDPRRFQPERTIMPIALSRKNALFAGHDAGAENWATIASLIEICKLNSVDPLAYLTSTLTTIINGHKQSRIGELLPWNCPAG